MQLNTKQYGNKGFTDVYCTVNGTKSTNKMTLPFIHKPALDVQPPFKDFYRRNYTFDCVGSIAPQSDSTVHFSLNSSTIATIAHGKMTLYGKSGLQVFQENEHSITVLPTERAHNGTYSCSMDFDVPGNHLSTLYSAGWQSYYRA